MSVTEIPAKYRWTCDRCKMDAFSDRAADRPGQWSRFLVERDAYDYQGVAIADASVSGHLCYDCTEAVTVVILGK